MRDFLSSLVARRFSPGVAIRPRPPSLFEPAPRAPTPFTGDLLSSGARRSLLEPQEPADRDDEGAELVEAVVEREAAPPVRRERERRVTAERGRPVRSRTPASVLPHPPEVPRSEGERAEQDAPLSVAPSAPPEPGEPVAPVSARRAAGRPAPRPGPQSSRIEAPRPPDAENNVEPLAPESVERVLAPPPELQPERPREQKAPRAAPVRPRLQPRLPAAPSAEPEAVQRYEMREPPPRLAPASAPVRSPTPVPPAPDGRPSAAPREAPARSIKPLTGQEAARSPAAEAPLPVPRAAAPPVKPAVQLIRSSLEQAPPPRNEGPAALRAVVPEPPRLRTSTVTPSVDREPPPDAVPPRAAPQQEKPTGRVLTPARIVIEPLAARAPAPGPVVQPPSANEPTPPTTVTVTIGRIEVRATPPAVSAGNKARPAAPSLTLEEYLRQRSSGGNR